MKIKRIISFILACFICSLSIYSCFSCVDVSAADSQKFMDWSTLDRDKWGPGKSWDECTDEEKAYRRSSIIAGTANEVAKGSLYLLNIAYPGAGTLASDAYEGFQNYLVKNNAIASGATTYQEYMIENAGLGYLLDKDYGSKIDLNNLNLNYSPQFLNYSQKYFTEKADESTQLVTIPVRHYGNLGNYRFGGGTDPTGSDLYMMTYCKDLIQVHGFCGISWYSWANQVYIWWLDGKPSDYYIYTNQLSDYIYNGKNYGKRAILCFRRKDGNDVVVNRIKFSRNESQGTFTKGDLETTSFHGDYRSNNSWSYGNTSYPSDGGFPWVNTGVSGDVWNENGRPSSSRSGGSGMLMNDIKVMKIYRSYGAVETSETYGAIIPAIMQNTAAIKEWTEAQSVNSGDVITYNYSTIVNQIGDPSNYDQQALQDKINELMQTLQGSIEEGNHINQEGWSDNRDLLTQIRDYVKDIYHNMGSGSGGGSGVISDIADLFHWSELQVKLDAIIALLGLQTLSDWFDDATDVGADLIDVGTDIGDAIILKFPFCLPWDMMLILNALKSIPETPVFEIPVDINSWNLHETITLDLHDFQVLSDISKWFFDILYGFAITKLTLKILQVEIVGTTG